MPWIHYPEDYTRQSYHSSYDEYECYTTYTNVHELKDEQSKISNIEVNNDHNDFDIKVRFAKSQDAENFEKTLSKNVLFYRDGPFVVMHYKSDAYQKGLLLKALISLEPRVKEIAEVLFTELRLEVLDELRKMPTEDAIDLAFNNQANNFSRAEWLLLDYIDNKKIPANAIRDLINRITPKNPCYKAMNDLGLKIVASPLPNPLTEHKAEPQSLSLDSETINEEDRIKELETRLAFALNGSIKGLADVIYSQLCNDPYDMEPLEGVSGNHQFLVNQARRIREERAAAKLTQNPLATSSASTSSVATSSASTSSVATSSVSTSSVATSSASTSPVVSQPPVNIRLPGPRVSRLLSLFNHKPTSNPSATNSAAP